MDRIAVPIADVWEDAQARRLARQFLCGDAVECAERQGDMVFVRRKSDGYPGWVSQTALAERAEPNFWVRSFGTLAFEEPDIKSPAPIRLPFFGAVSGTPEGKFTHTDFGYVPTAHLSEDPVLSDDPIAVAERFLGVPYLWGGNSELGIDCSGLSQKVFAVCGVDIPSDSGAQWAALGKTDTPQRGDICFWEGHLAILVDDDTFIHANAHHMCVAYEPVADTLKRIEASGERYLGFARVSPRGG